MLKSIYKVYLQQVRQSLDFGDVVCLWVACFQLFTLVLSGVGFAYGWTISHYHMPISLIASIFVACYYAHDGACRTAGWLFSIFLGVVLVSSLPVMYSVSDGNVYHRAGVALLSNGWNPLFLTEPQELTAIWKGYRAWHVAYLPKGAWIFGAAMYKFFGYIDIADSFNVFAILLAVMCGYRWTGQFGLGRLCRICVSSLCVFGCPYVLPDVFGGVNDSAFFCYLFVAAISTDEYYRTGKKFALLLAEIASVMLCGIKFTGIVFVVILNGIYFGAILLEKLRNRKGKSSAPGEFLLSGIFAAILVAFAHANPYFTNSINHYSPLYPVHSFVASHIPEDKLTYDFDQMNEDAREMGWFGRFANAYVSSSATKGYYRSKLHRNEFSPRVYVFDGVEGLGGVFRMTFSLALLGVLFLRNKSHALLIAVLLLSVFAQPTKFVGYSRYVPQIWLIPIIVWLSILDRFGFTRWRQICFVCSILIVMAFVTMPRLVAYPYMWLTSVQNLQIIAGAEKDSKAIVGVNTLNGLAIWCHDIPAKIRVVNMNDFNNVEGLNMYAPCSGRYRYWSGKSLPGFYAYSFPSVAFDPSSTGRRSGAAQYFLKEFLPKEIAKLFPRVATIFSLRCRQICRNWSRVDDCRLTWPE